MVGLLRQFCGGSYSGLDDTLAHPHWGREYKKSFSVFQTPQFFRTNAAESVNPELSSSNSTRDERVNFGPWWSIVPNLNDYRDVFIMIVLVLMVVSVLR